MSSTQPADFLFFALALLLPLSALIARRIPGQQLLVLALIWLAIIGGGVLIVRLVQTVTHPAVVPAH